MARYATTGQENAVTTSLTTALSLTGGTGVRPNVYDFSVSQSGTPADNTCRWALMRHTVAPTVTAVTPAPLDSADPAAECASGENASAEGTVTAATEIFDQNINQRAAYRWVAAPGGEIYIPATAANGLSFRTSSPAYTGAADASAHFQE